MMSAFQLDTPSPKRARRSGTAKQDISGLSPTEQAKIERRREQTKIRQRNYRQRRKDGIGLGAPTEENKQGQDKGESSSMGNPSSHTDMAPPPPPPVSFPFPANAPYQFTFAGPSLPSEQHGAAQSTRNDGNGSNAATDLMYTSHLGEVLSDGVYTSHRERPSAPHNPQLSPDDAYEGLYTFPHSPQLVHNAAGPSRPLGSRVSQFSPDTVPPQEDDDVLLPVASDTVATKQDRSCQTEPAPPTEPSPPALPTRRRSFSVQTLRTEAKEMSTQTETGLLEQGRTQTVAAGSVLAQTLERHVKEMSTQTETPKSQKEQTHAAPLPSGSSSLSPPAPASGKPVGEHTVTWKDGTVTPLPVVLDANGVNTLQYDADHVVKLAEVAIPASQSPAATIINYDPEMSDIELSEMIRPVLARGGFVVLNDYPPKHRMHKFEMTARGILEHYGLYSDPDFVTLDAADRTNHTLEDNARARKGLKPKVRPVRPGHEFLQSYHHRMTIEDFAENVESAKYSRCILDAPSVMDMRPSFLVPLAATSPHCPRPPVGHSYLMPGHSLATRCHSPSLLSATRSRTMPLHPPISGHLLATSLPPPSATQLMDATLCHFFCHFPPPPPLSRLFPPPKRPLFSRPSVTLPFLSGGRLTTAIVTTRPSTVRPSNLCVTHSDWRVTWTCHANNTAAPPPTMPPLPSAATSLPPPCHPCRPPRADPCHPLPFFCHFRPPPPLSRLFPPPKRPLFSRPSVTLPFLFGRELFSLLAQLASLLSTNNHPYQPATTQQFPLPPICVLHTQAGWESFSFCGPSPPRTAGITTFNHEASQPAATLLSLSIPPPP
ncbi:hypothetical protein BXZ70DRAFT_909620 [Cristinia sonorae]|uniref:BZIP domain-containing protein n=1 Tax=Cristinia sonorae TaxID=1940300 RepID=A0A8K0XLZ2_9AGAR|nr:hypothetical protein BXZ70DRAFT_909620 [Cristinia sonorae]